MGDNDFVVREMEDDELANTCAWQECLPNQSSLKN
jgi:hypothetical protein